jgi:Ni/Co efflux regulator RcnB
MKSAFDYRHRVRRWQHEKHRQLLVIAMSRRTAFLLALSMSFAGAAMAQDHHDQPERRDHPREQQHRAAPPPHGPDHVADERGAGPDHDFRRGGRLPPEYRNRQYVVDNWREHHLSAPPRGYHWIQTGPDYVLAAIATGVIAQVLLGH